MAFPGTLTDSAGKPVRRTTGGGFIPGVAAIAGDDAHAFVVSDADPSPLPVLIAVPHAGRAYPPTLIQQMRNPAYAALRLEDRYVDLLGERVAHATGAALIVARAPRAMIDLNRAADDVDWDMISRPSRDSGPQVLHPVEGAARFQPGRARSGLGLIPRRLPGIGELWKTRHGHDALSARVSGIHQPYHAAVESMLQAMRERWGAALLFDLHSMPPLALRGMTAPEFVVGDRFGATCSGQVVAAMFSGLARLGRPSSHNRPYAGGYVLERHGAPRRGIHALQLEVARASYLDSRLSDPGEGFEEMVDILVRLVRAVAAEVADLGRAGRGGEWAEAAE